MTNGSRVRVKQDDRYPHAGKIGVIDHIDEHGRAMVKFDDRADAVFDKNVGNAAGIHIACLPLEAIEELT